MLLPRRALPRPAADPEVSVVLICYNDRANLPRAIRSVQDQTLRHVQIIVVDDASSDGSADVADGFADDDPRITVVRLPENSGGCSRPRNVGMEHARAPYVMFLDSDDYFERHACKNLLLTAERTGADVVSGRVTRVLVTKGRRGTWTKQLYERRAVYRGIRENPQLFMDPLSTNKLYRREFLDRHGIRFPEGIHYEDSLFSTQVYCQAEVIALVPNVVYFWRIVHDDEEEEFSITQRRFEIQNFSDRLTVHRMMDEFLSGHGSADLKVFKDYKFIHHDLRLYLRDLPHRPEGYRQEMVRLAAEYLATVSDATLELCHPVERICVHMIRRQDVEETLKTVAFMMFGFKLATSLVERDGRVYWTEKYLDEPGMRDVLDVTRLDLHRLPFERLPLYNEVRSIGAHRGRLLIEGAVLNQLGRIPRDADLVLSVSVRNRGRARWRRAQVQEVRHDGDEIAYTADLGLSRVLGGLDREVPVWDMRLQVDWRGRTATAPFSIDPALVEDVRLPVRARLGGFPAGTLQPVVSTQMNLALQQVPGERGLGRAAARGDRLARRALASVRWRTNRVVDNPALKKKAYRLFQRLPVKRGVAVFESHMGRHYSDSPKYIFEAAREAGLDRLGLRPVWSYRQSPRGFPADATLVRRESWRYYYALARAEYWIDNQGFPRQFTRRRDTTYIQTWHGTPLKLMGFDAPSLERANAATRRVHQAMLSRWSALTVPSEYFVETFVRSYRYEGRLVRHGLPRNDLLVRGVDQDWVRAKKRELNLPEDRTLVLYCPTFRDRARRLGKEFDLAVDLDVFQRELAGEAFLMVRTHYLDSYKVPVRYTPVAANVSGYPDVTELMLVADVLVTDYSSVMFDFANTGKPMVFFAYDYDDYARDERGTYVDLPDVAPGPIVTDTPALVEALRDIDSSHAAFRDRYAAFRERFCAYETGRASEHVVKEFFEKGGRP